MPDPSWPSTPPEANYLRLAGPGAGGTATTLACSAAWQALMASHEAAVAASSLNTAVTALNFEGAGGTESASAAAGLNAALQLLAGWAQEKPPIAGSAVAAYEMAISAMIPAEVAAANRAEQAADVALNPLVFGALTPAIVALDTVYFGEFWPQNAATGAAYGATLTALVAALAVPPPLSPPGTSAAAPVAAAAAAAESAGQAAAGQAISESSSAVDSAGGATPVPAAAATQAGRMASMLGQPLQAAGGSLQPLSGMFSAPVQAMQALVGLPQSMGGLSVAPSDSDGIGTHALPPGILGGAALPGVGTSGSLGLGSGSTSAGVGTVGTAGAGGAPGNGLTSYTRPPSGFAPENAGRPTGLRPPPLTNTDLRGTGSAMGGSPVPVPPQPAQNRNPTDKAEVAVARIVAAPAKSMKT